MKSHESQNTGFNSINKTFFDPCFVENISTYMCKMKSFLNPMINTQYRFRQIVECELPEKFFFINFCVHSWIRILEVAKIDRVAAIDL